MLDWMRVKAARVRRRYSLRLKVRELQEQLAALEANLPYETGEVEGFARARIMGIEETLGYVLEKGCSMARFGDGEFRLLRGEGMAFEKANEELRERLAEVLSKPQEKCLCCLPGMFGSLAKYTAACASYWRGCMAWIRPLAEEFVAEQPLGETMCTRAYMDFRDKDSAKAAFDAWKKIFAGRDLLVAEGENTKFGIGNDLLAGAATVRRIACPGKCAFARYDEIRREVAANVHEGDLVLLALGPTATVLAYDLAKDGVQALDAGHLDVEYTWMNIGVKEKTPIPGKAVWEA